MRLLPVIILVLAFTWGSPGPLAQSADSPIKVFGYFQTSFQQWTAYDDHPDNNTFNLQQMNLFLQKDLGSDWTAFINLEFLNNFSSGRRWGSFSLEEAWIRYRKDNRLQLKIGLLTPIFNNLNEIKNRTPLLPYIIRPLAYETSFNEFIDVDAFTPIQAFTQVYGFIPWNGLKFDYALYLGNSPNINNDPTRGQTGIDTTTTLLYGGRVGLRFNDIKLGFSGTYDNDNVGTRLAPVLSRPISELNELPRRRLGADLSVNIAPFQLEGEFIDVKLGDDPQILKQEVSFYYATLGYHLTEQFFAYGSYWYLDSQVDIASTTSSADEFEDISIPTMGIYYNLTDRVRFKAQHAWVAISNEFRDFGETATAKVSADFRVATVAISVWF